MGPARRIRAYDPYYRLTGRDPALSPPLWLGIVGAVIGFSAYWIGGSVWGGLAVVVGVVVVMEVMTRVVEWRRSRRAGSAR